jgi:pyruvate, water dikinase
VDFLLHLDQLQTRHEGQAGDRLLTLSRLLKSGYPVRTGFVVPDEIMRTVWSQMNSSDEILQDFPYLRLNFSLDQAAQVRGIAQTLQQKILKTPSEPQWQMVWTQGIRQLKGQQLRLTPYLWATGKLEHSISTRVSLDPLFCDIQVDSLWQTLKVLWSKLFQAQNLYILQHLELRPEQVHLSVLVQASSPQQSTGYLKVTPTHFVLQFNDDREQGWIEPEGYVYERLTQEWMRVNPDQRHPKKSLSVDGFESIVDLCERLDRDGPAVPFSWKITLDDFSSVQILGIVPELPLPISIPMQRRIQGRSQTQTALTDASVQTALNARQPLGKGAIAAAGSIAAPVVVVHDFQTISPEQIKGAILVTHHLEPMHLPWLKASVGLICESGSLTSHGAILARELGRPAIVGTSGILQILQNGQWVFLDGNQGEVYACEETEGLTSSPHSNPLRLSQSQESLCTTAQVLVQLSQTSLLDLAQTTGADGVGVIRGEWLLLEQLSTLSEPLQNLGAKRTLGAKLSPLESVDFNQQVQNALFKILRAFEPMPAYYRLTDLSPSDRPLLMGKLEETTMGCHPALGLRGTLWHCHDPRLFEMEIRMIQAVLNKGSKNLKVVLPFVRSPQEVQVCVEKMHAMGIDPRHDVSLWMMAEVPSILFDLDRYAPMGIQGIMIGINDFTQLLLGVDRDHSAFAEVLNHNRPVLMSAISQLVQRATALNLSSILCGSVVHYPVQWLEALLSDGLMGISVDIDNVAATRRAIAQAEHNLSGSVSSVTPQRLQTSEKKRFLPQS